MLRNRIGWENFHSINQPTVPPLCFSIMSTSMNLLKCSKVPQSLSLVMAATAKMHNFRALHATSKRFWPHCVPWFCGTPSVPGSKRWQCDNRCISHCIVCHNRNSRPCCNDNSNHQCSLFFFSFLFFCLSFFFFSLLGLDWIRTKTRAHQRDSKAIEFLDSSV